MPDAPDTITFDEDRAASYARRLAFFAPIKDALNLITRVALSELPDDARVLVVGAGTGSELLDLATAFPGWRFVAVDPAPAMLRRCRANAKAAGVAARCTFHEGTLDTLADSGPFDGATCLLVSHFLTDRDARRGLFEQLRARLVPGGVLASADIAADLGSPSFERLWTLWARAQQQAGLSEGERADMRRSFGTKVAVVPPAEVAALMTEAGLAEVEPVYQSLLMHGFVSRRPAG